MISDVSSESEMEQAGNDVQRSVKKCKKSGKMTDVIKKLRASSHCTGEDCKCTRYKCFENVSLEERKRIITNFNLLGDYNKQN